MARPTTISIIRRSLASAALVVCLLASFQGAFAQSGSERIISFLSDITVETDGTLQVRETITVHANGTQIKRGIFREFPTLYEGDFGLHENVDFEILEVLRDGRPEPYFTQKADNGIRIYIGQQNVFLDEADYTYTIAYRTDRQLIFADGYDEVYWSVTGSGWAFPIERAIARITLPAGAKPMDLMGYTGPQGDDGQDYTSSIEAGGVAVFTTTRALAPYEGLTVAVSFPKGHVAEPSGMERTVATIGDNLGLLVGVAGLIVTSIYFFLMWNWIGRDPEKGVVIPLFAPPADMSPVVVGYIANWGLKGRFNKARAFSVAITSMAVKGALTIDAREDGSFTVDRTDDESADLSPGEQTAFDKLFGPWQRSITFDRTYDPAIRSAVDKLAALINREYTNIYFRENWVAWLGGAIIAIACATLAAMFDIRGSANVIGVVLASTFGLIAIFVIVSIGVRVMRERSFILVLVAVAVIVGGLLTSRAAAGIQLPDLPISYPVLVVMLLNAGLVVLFWFLMRAPTMHGRKVMDQIGGYKLYLSVAEADRMNMLGAEPDMSEELFERHLPYAMALNVADAWTEHFEAQIPPEQLDQSRSRRRWYRSHDGSSRPSSMISNLSGGLSSTISSAATRPSSSSSGGSSGGGSSGGGGGGGGGGGW